ncbi:trypsin-like serine protease [Clavibacter michiganensis]|nr:trypsin-like serine protease [Clavibacter michiganensis]MBW8027947.1 trypsin-like serine protease [Clavibacter michiganensis subsp. michiganensis]MDO4066761.1 trypsin-like serine protease [Clavibacter michiganensis]MDO4073261.1 trypsin-like serine protease [Clavibacter michiganensis]MDO4091903.1 trypsin-like serine protease [Clavibacter michiganensis]
MPQRRRQYNRFFRLFVLSLLLSVTPAVTTAIPAQAVGSNRTSLPIVAGSVLTFHSPTPPGTYSADVRCTAGAVLKSTTLYSRILPFAAAKRYIPTAKHCGDLNADVYAGDTNVGKVIWQSPDRDLELVEVDPVVSRSTHCSGTPSGAPRCSIVQSYAPRAVGKILLNLPFSNFERAVPIAGTGDPNSTQSICISGYVTGVNCTFKLVTLPPTEEAQARSRGQKVIRSGSRGSESGDSGGPVSSESGVLFGIHHGSADPTRFKNVSIYTPISEFFREQPNYAIAPSS